MQLSGFILEDFRGEDGIIRKGWVSLREKGGKHMEDDDSPSDVMSDIDHDEANHMYGNAAVGLDGSKPKPAIRTRNSFLDEREDEAGWVNAGVYEGNPTFVTPPTPHIRIRTSSLSLENMFEAFTRGGWFGSNGGNLDNDDDGTNSGKKSYLRKKSDSNKSFFGSFLWADKATDAKGILPVKEDTSQDVPSTQVTTTDNTYNRNSFSADRPPLIPNSPLGTSLDDVTVNSKTSGHSSSIGTHCSASEFDKRERDIIVSRGSYALGGPTTLNYFQEM